MADSDKLVLRLGLVGFSRVRVSVMIRIRFSFSDS